MNSRALAMAAALAAAASPGLARADALSTASKAVALDLAAGARAGTSGVKIDALTYSGSGWSKASGGSATVTGFREGSADGVILRLVDGAAGEGTFSFTPVAAGTWALTHTSDGGEAKARFAVASNGAEAEGVALAADSAKVALDLTAGVRTWAAGMRALSHSGGNWVYGEGGDATVTFVQDGGSLALPEKTYSGDGTFSFAPIASGTWLVTHKAADGSSVSARFAYAADEGETGGAVLAGDSATVALDLVAGTRSIARLSEIGGITYSGGNWVYGAEGTAYTGLAGPGVAAAVTERTGEGTYAFTPGVAGLWTLTHTVGDATVVARFQIETSAIDAGPGDEAGAAWLDEDAIANATAVVITAITQASADSWNVTFRPVLQTGRSFADWVETSDYFDNIRIRRATTLAGLDEVESEVEPIEAIGYDEVEGTVTVTIEATDDAAMFFRIVIAE